MKLQTVASRRACRPALLAMFSALALAACGGKNDAAPTQVVASVNQGEISVHQLNHALQQRPDLEPLGDGAPAKVLDELIDQELAVQAAVGSQLDRDPGVLLTLEAGRREVLARAYLQRTAAATARPNPSDVARYYAEQPALFRQRRVYILQELDIEVPPADVPALEARLGAAKSAAEVERLVAAAKLRHTAQQATRVPEALPMNVLDKVAGLTEGQTAFVPTPRGVRTMTLVSAMAAPVSEEQARPIIEQYLWNRERGLTAQAQLKTLRDHAEIRRSPALVAAAAAASSSPSTP